MKGKDNMCEVAEEIKNKVRASIERELSGIASVNECTLDLFVFKMTVKVDGWKHTTRFEITNDADGIVFLLNAEQKEFTARKKTQIKPDENFWRIVGLPPAYAQGIGVMIRDFMSSVAKAASEKGVSL